MLRACMLYMLMPKFGMTLNNMTLDGRFGILVRHVIFHIFINRFSLSNSKKGKSEAKMKLEEANQKSPYILNKPKRELG